MDSSTIERELRIEASPETVYSYFVDPEKLTQWMAERAEIDPRPGGGIRLDMNGFDISRGEFVELVPFSRVVFTWGWESLGDGPRPGQTTVEVTLRADGSGTVLKLIHHGLPATTAKDHDEGWGYFLGILASTAARGERTLPEPAPMPEATALAAQLNTLLCEAREVLESTDDEQLAQATPGTGWPAATTFSHLVGHITLAHFAVETARGERSPIADMTAEQLDANNAGLGDAERPTRDALMERLRADGPAAVEALRALPDESLDNNQPMAFAGGHAMTARDLIQEPLLHHLREHLHQVKAALAQESVAPGR